jgi:hypothetical protein
MKVARALYSPKSIPISSTHAVEVDCDHHVQRTIGVSDSSQSDWQSDARSGVGRNDVRNPSDRIDRLSSCNGSWLTINNRRRNARITKVVLETGASGQIELCSEDNTMSARSTNALAVHSI